MKDSEEDDVDGGEPRIHFKDGKSRNAKEALKDALKINAKVDLIEAALSHVEFLEDVDKFPCLYEGEFLLKAIRRYEELWLPLAANHEQERLAAPLDIEWVWHCHMLSPKKYENDCNTLFQKTINHKLFRRHDRKHALRRSRLLWEKHYPNEKFDLVLPVGVHRSDVTAENYNSRLNYDLVNAASRQGAFQYNVSLSHWFDMQYLSRCLVRYKMFLYLRANSKDSFLVPCYDIDLMWHTHQLHPIIYKKDTVRILGYHLNHDDTTTDRNPGSKLSVSYTKTRKLWRTLYDQDYSMPGAMYRGTVSRGTFSENNLNIPISEDTVLSSQMVLTFESISLDRVPDGDYGFSFIIDIFLCNNERKDQVMKLSGPYMIWSKEDMKPVPLKTLENSSILFRLSLKKGNLFSRNSVLCQKALDLNFPRKRPSSIMTFREQVSLKGIENNILYLQGQIEHVFPMSHINMKFGDFQKTIYPKDIDLPLQSIESKGNQCELCDTSYISECRFLYGVKEMDLTCKVFHSSHRNMTVAQFLLAPDEMICSLKMVDSSHLPLPTQVSNSDSILTLNPTLYQRAFLIRDNTGDWGIVTGWWGKYAAEKREAMHFTFYRCADSNIQRITAMFHDEQYRVKVDQCSVDIEGAVFKLSCSPQEVAQYLAFGIAIGLLHVFCIPRPHDWSPGQMVKMDKTHHLKLDQMKLLIACGLHIETPSNYFRFERKKDGQ